MSGVEGTKQSERERGRYVHIYMYFAFLQAVEKEYERQVAAGELSGDLAFAYAYHLIKSGFKNDIRKGIAMMEREGEREKERETDRGRERERGRKETWNCMCITVF